MQNPNNLSVMIAQIKSDLDKNNAAYKENENLIHTQTAQAQTLEKTLNPKIMAKKKKEDEIRKQTQEIEKMGAEIKAIETKISTFKAEAARASAVMGSIRLNLLKKQAELQRVNEEYARAIKSSAIKPK